MTSLKLLAAAAVFSAVVAAPAMAQDYRYDNGYRYRDAGPVGVAADVVGGAVATGAAIATAPFRGAYAYDNAPYGAGYYGRGPAYDADYARRNGFVCQPGTLFRGEDGRTHLCQ